MLLFLKYLYSKKILHKITENYRNIKEKVEKRKKYERMKDKVKNNKIKKTKRKISKE